MTLVRVSIAIPFYNNRATLTDAIRSIFAQTHRDWELLLIDDGSVDGSLEIARSIRDDRVRVYSDGIRLGLASRLNQAARLAGSTILARMDADDLAHPERIARQHDFLIERPDVDLVASAIVVIDAESRPTGQRPIPEGFLSNNQIVRGLTLAHPTATGRIEWWRRNPYDENYPRGQDFELWCRAARNHDARIYRLAEKLLFYRDEGAANYAKLVTGCQQRIKTLRRHGYALERWSVTTREILKMHLKQLAYRGAHLVRTKANLRKNAPLPEAEQREAWCVIQRILATDIPGLTQPIIQRAAG